MQVERPADQRKEDLRTIIAPEITCRKTGTRRESPEVTAGAHDSSRLLPIQAGNRPGCPAPALASACSRSDPSSDPLRRAAEGRQAGRALSDQALLLKPQRRTRGSS